MAQPFSRTTRSLARDSGRFTFIAFGVAGVMLAAWGAWFLLGRVTLYELSQHARLEAVAAPRPVTALQSGRLSQWRLQVGQRVHAGDLLAELDTAPDALRAQEGAALQEGYPARIAALRQQIAALQAATGDDREASGAGVASAKARLEEAQADAAYAADRAARMRALGDSGTLPAMEVLKAATEARKAAATRDALAAEVRRQEMDARTRGDQRLAEVEELKAQLAGLESQSSASTAILARQSLEVENHRLRSPVDGVVAEAQPLHAGAYVAQGQALATIVPDGAGLLIVADFDPATALGRLRPGQRARVRLDGYPWAQYGVVEARVVRVSGEVRDRGLRTELVPLRPHDGGPALRHGLTGAVEVGVETLSPADLLLRAAGRKVVARGAAAPAVAR